MKDNIEVFELLKLLCIVYSGWRSREEHEIYLKAKRKINHIAKQTMLELELKNLKEE